MLYYARVLRTGSDGSSLDVIAYLRACGCMSLYAFPCLFVSRLHTVTAARKSSAVLEIHQEV